MVLPKHLRVLSIVIGMSLMMACADQKGFQARITKPEELLRQKGIDPQSEEGQQFIKARLAAPQVVEIPPAKVNQAQNGTEGAAATPPSKGSPEDQEVVQGFAKIVREAVQKGGGAPVGAKPVNPKAMPPQTAAEVAERARLEKVEKLKVINASLNPKVNEILKGIDVRVVADGDAKASAKELAHKISVGINLIIQNKAYLSNAEGILTPKNQFKKTDIVPLKVTREFDATDLNETKIAKIEYFAACESDSEMCETVVVMILFNRADDSKISFVGRFRFDGQGLGTALGNQLMSVAQAQEEFAKKKLASSEVAPAAVKSNQPAEGPKPVVASKGEKAMAAPTGTGQRLLENMRKQDAKTVEADLKAYLEKLDKEDKAKTVKPPAQASSSPAAAAAATEAEKVPAKAVAKSQAPAPEAEKSKEFSQWFVDVGNSIWDSVSSIWGPTTPARKTDVASPPKTPSPMRY